MQSRQGRARLHACSDLDFRERRNCRNGHRNGPRARADSGTDSGVDARASARTRANGDETRRFVS